MATILIVDDRVGNRDYLTTLLGYDGHRLLEAANGAAALALLRAERPHLVITDILMPTMDGYEFAQLVRGDPDPSIARIPIIFYTATYNAREGQALALAAGVHYLIAKPAEPQAILDTVNAALGLDPALPAKTDSGLLEDPLRAVGSKLTEKMGELNSLERRLAALVELMLKVSAEREPERLLEIACGAARSIIGGQYAAIGMLGDDRQSLRHFVTSGLEAETIGRIGPLPAGKGVLGRLLAEGKPLRLADLSADPSSVGLTPGHPPTWSFLGVPIASPGGLYGGLYLTEKIGAIEFSAEDERLAVALASLVAAAYENVTRYDEIQAHAARLQLEITQRRKAEASLAQTNDLLSRAERIGHIGSWSWDLGANRVVWSDGMYRIFGLNTQEFGATYEAYLERVHPADRERVRMAVDTAYREHGTLEYESRIVLADGRIRVLDSRAEVVLDDCGHAFRLVGIGIDITERKQAEAALAASEAQLRGLFAAMTDVVVVLDAGGHFLQIAPTNPGPLIKPSAALLGRTVYEVLPKEGADKLLEEIQRSLQLQQAIQVQNSLTVQGAPVWFDGTVSPIGPDHVVWVARDVTERRQRQLEMQAIATVSTALRNAATRAQMSPIILDQLLDLFRANGSAFDLYDAASGNVVIESARGAWAALAGQRVAPGQGIIGHVIASGETYVNDDARSDPRLFPAAVIESVRALACVPVFAQGQPFGGLWVGRETPFGNDDIRVLTAIAEIAGNAFQRATLHEQTERRLRHLAALRAIDLAISSSLDLHTTLDVVLDQILNQLSVDAASVLLLSPHGDSLDYAAGRGFRSPAGERSSLRLGEGFSGRAALERRMLALPDLAEAEPGAALPAVLSGEGFQGYYGVPLLAKDLVHGVLEVFHRAPLHPDSDWVEFLETLAGQAAIAIDNNRLFNGLQRSNVDLSLAYESTIEGWSRALDLRDRETEGHSQRVTEMTLVLACARGMDEQEQLNVRRGALLHDIGKMGIPDSILLKPGPLTPDEWVIMRQHPVLAYQLLSPIIYLHPALDVPYCHHEKWDGSGYPRGLKAEQIPLSARLFAVVDVWDALRSDRPYRARWPEQTVREYIRGQAGSHFDPAVVQLFLNMDRPDDH